MTEQRIDENKLTEGLCDTTETCKPERRRSKRRLAGCMDRLGHFCSEPWSICGMGYLGLGRYHRDLDQPRKGTEPCVRDI